MSIKGQIAQVKTFVSEEIWKVNDSTDLRSKLIVVFRILLITLKEFKRDKIVLQASAVTYLTLLSIVPTLALIFGITKGFGEGINVQEEISRLFPAAQDIIFTTTFDSAQRMLDNAKGGVIAGVGTFVLFFTVMKLMNNIEGVFNSIWGIKSARSWVRKFTDYLAILVVAPILVVLSSSATVFVATQIRSAGEKLQMEALIGPLVLFFVKLSPYVLIWLLFSLIYIIMPNTRVKAKSGIIAGVLAGTVFEVTQWGFINFSVGVAKYNAIYGSLAALPLFIVFVQLSWTIVLVGGEFAFALDKHKEYVPDEKNTQFSYNENKKIALMVMRNTVKVFEEGLPPLTKVQLSTELNIPYRFVSNAVDALVDAGLLIKSMPEKELDHVYTPSFDINKMDLYIVMEKLENHGVSGLLTDHVNGFIQLQETLDELQDTAKKTKANKLLKNIQ